MINREDLNIANAATHSGRLLSRSLAPSLASPLTDRYTQLPVNRDPPSQDGLLVLYECTYERGKMDLAVQASGANAQISTLQNSCCLISVVSQTDLSPGDVVSLKGGTIVPSLAVSA